MSPAARLRFETLRAVEDGTIGGASVLEDLSALASACASGNSREQDAVAYVLSRIFAEHAYDRDERAVTAEENYPLLAGDADLREAVDFIGNGGKAEEAIRIIAALIRLGPDRVQPGRWPPTS